MKEKKFTVLVAALVGVLLLLYLISYQVRINETAVHYRFGRVVKVVNEQGDQAGWYLKWPYPIDTLSRFDRRVAVFEGKLSETTTSDKVNVIPRVYVAWRIADARGFVASLGRDEKEAVTKAVESLKSISNTAISSALGTHSFANLVSTDPAQLKVVAIEQEAEQYLKDQARKLYSIDIVGFGIKRIALPQEVTAKVFDRMKKERERVRDDFRARGDAEAKKIVARADKQREEILAQARADAKMIIAEGEVEAAKYLPVFAQNPALHDFLIKLDAMLQIAKESKDQENKPVFILDTKTEPWSLFETGPNVQPLEPQGQGAKAPAGK